MLTASIILWICIDLKSLKWILTTERLVVSFGVFSRRTDNLELYRVKDLILKQPLNNNGLYIV